MELQVKGMIKSIEDTQEGVNKAGDTWQKLIYTVETDAQYNNLYAFEVFGKDAVTQFKQYNKPGDKVTVKFNVNTNEWQGKFYTTLQSWRCEKDSASTPKNEVGATEEEVTDDLPF